MARLTGTTKTIINDYYKEIIRRKENERCDIEKNYCLEVIEQFNQDSDVLKVRELLNILKERYNCEFDVSLPRYKIHYEVSPDYINKIEEIKQIKRERDELLVSLDYLPKNSKEYKQAVTKLNNIIKGE